MKKLILMRHAKSSWSTPGLSDHDRPLNDRGQRSAKAIGDWLRQENLHPTECFVSTAKRTQQTFLGLALGVEQSPKDALYHASSEQMLQVLRAAQTDTVLLLGHNPGIAYLAEELVTSPPDHPRFFDFPTGATLVLDFDFKDWTTVTLRAGKVLRFVIPRELIN